jgi:hypothetical protein
MKKTCFALMLVSSLMMVTFTQSCSVAQKEITSTTATTSRGYTVVNPGEAITVYKYMHPSHSPKENERYGPKYYYTTGSSVVLKELTKANLKKEFPENHPFHDALDANFKQDAELTNYDDFHKMYKINWLLQNNNK